VQLSRPNPLGVARDVAWVPTDDPSKRPTLGPDAALFAGGRWAPAGLSVLGHQLTVNIASGGLTLAATDIDMPYHALSFGVARIFDAQEQYAQESYLDSHPNTDPRIHLFANWQHSREAAVSEVWESTFPELLVSDGSGESALYYRAYPEFAVNTMRQAEVEERLRAYGVPGRTLEALGWTYGEFDCVLRSRQGSFSVLAGNYRAETLVDPADMRLYRFDVLAGTGSRYSSEFAYQQLLDSDGTRETTVPGLVVDVVDGLGHRVSFRPIELQPPYRSYQLQDGAGRCLRFELKDHIDYLDGTRPGSTVKTYIVSRVIDATRADNNMIEYHYDSGRLAAVRYPGHAGSAQRVYRYDYDNRGRLVKLTDPVGNSFTLEYIEDVYDTDERLMPRLKVSRLRDGEGNEARYTYNNATREVTVTFTGTAGDTRTIVYSYTEDAADTRQRYITSERIAVALGYSGSQVVETQWRYSSDGHFVVTAIADALGGTTSLEHNDFNQVTRQVDAAGHARNFTYDNRTTPSPSDPHRYDIIRVSETNIDADGNALAVVTQATFNRYNTATSADALDARQSTHRTATRTNELGAVFRFEYDEAGSYFPVRPTRYIDALGNIATRDYDATGLPVRETDAEGNTQQMTYNAQGQQLSHRDANGFERRWVYDSASLWMTDFTDALGAAPGDPAHSIHYEFTAAGQRSRETDPIGTTLEYAYAANKRLKSVTQRDPAPRTLAFVFNACGALTEIHDPAGHATYFGIDEAGRVYATYRDSAANPSIKTRFDAAGRPVETTDRNGQKTSFGYDAVGRVVFIQEPDWPAATLANPGKQVTIDYDQLGRRLRVTDSELPRPSRYAYDAAGNLTSATEAFGPSLSNTYDACNALTLLQGSDAAVRLQFGRDRAGRLSSVTDSTWQDPSRTFQFVRAEGSLVDNLYRIDGPSGLVTRFSYDANRRVTATSAQSAAATVCSYGYQYRADGLLGGATGDHAGEYDYDGIKRLIRESDAGVASAYDAAGNRLWRRAAAPPPNQVNTYDLDNRLTGTPADGTTYVYDKNGNLLIRQPAAGVATHYQYDGANRLRQVEQGGLRLTYLYDINGRLLERSRTSGGATRRERYWHANRSILAVLDTSERATTVYTRADNGRLLRRRGIEPLSPLPASDAHSLFYLHDGLNSVVRLLDADGNSHLSVAYDAWGRATIQGPARGELFRYRGGFQDGDTGLLQFGRRWYDPALGRWLSQDPLLADVLVARRDVTAAVMDVANLYLYVGNSPLNFVDPSGLGPPNQWPAQDLLRKAFRSVRQGQANRLANGAAEGNSDRAGPEEISRSQRGRSSRHPG
jgi:RHS repeat-associated protein